MITGSMATLFLVLSLLGTVAFGVLLVLGLRMWRDERAAKNNPPPALQPLPELPAMPALVQPAALPASTPPAPDSNVAEAQAAELAASAPSGEPTQPAEQPPAAPFISASDPPATTSASEAAPLQQAALAEPAAPQAPPKALDKLFSVFNRTPAPLGQEILRVARDAHTGKLNIFIAGKPQANFNAIQDSAARQDFLTALRLLQAFTNNALIEASPAGLETTTARAPEQVKAPPPEPVIYRAAELPPPELPSMQPFQQLRKRPKSANFVIKSITEQIEDHLQDKIAGTPLARRGVHVHAESHGNAIFLLDGKIYETVDEVPDGEVRQVIREAISEWEQKT